METYEQGMEYLGSRINYERLHTEHYSTRDFKLDRMRRLLAAIGDPQERIPAVHIAGTKGKGSTAAMTARILQEAGLRVGLFTSPHISRFEERMQVDGHSPEPNVVVDLLRGLRVHVEAMEKLPGQMSPTYFEVATAMAWQYFVEQRADVVVLEVGIGGRLDATNICRPVVTVITNISRDHTALLGNTLAQIAREKAGIIKPGVSVISGVADEEPQRVIADVADASRSRLIQLGRDLHYQRTLVSLPEAGSSVDVQTPWRQWCGLHIPLAGAHQAANAALAVAACDALREAGLAIPPESVIAGLERVRWPARIEVLRQHPTVIVDTAHNVASITALVQTLRESFQARRKILVFAATRDKDVAGLLERVVGEFDSVILTQYRNNARAVPIAELRDALAAISAVEAHIAADPAAAWKLATDLAGPEDLICVTGSFFLAAEMRGMILNAAHPDLAPGEYTGGPVCVELRG